MSTVKPLYSLMAGQLEKYSRNERIFLEAVFFSSVCKQLKEIFREQHREYFRIMKLTTETENAMLDANFICFVIKDILSTNEYNLEGIAYYMGIHEDVLYEILMGKNNNPSATILQKIIDLHCSVRIELYRDFIKKIALDYLAVA